MKESPGIGVTGRAVGPTGTGLAARLALASGGLVLLVSGSIGFAALRSLQELGEQQARARVRLAGATAAQEVRLAGEEVLVAARLLAERPTLARLLAEEDVAALSDFLRQYCSTSGHDGCAVIADGEPFAVSIDELPWSGLALRQSGTELLDLVRSITELDPLQVATAHVPGRSDVVAMVVRRLDDAFAESIGRNVGLRVRIRPPASDGPVRGAGLSTSQGADVVPSITTVSASPGMRVYRAAYPLRAVDGTEAAVIETDLPADIVRASLRTVAGEMWAFVGTAAALAVLLGVALGYALAQPVRMLTAAAARIGRGDLATPVPPAAGKEAAALSRAMDDMRRRVRDLTAELRSREHEAQALLRGIEEGVFAVDAARRISYVNPQGAALLGLAAGDVVGRFCGDVLDPEPVDGRSPCHQDCPILHARSRGSSSATEHLRRHDGSRCTVVITSSTPSEGRQVQVFRPETDLEGARRTRDAILANISHEFRTPLAAQLASIELLRDRINAIDPEAAAELVGAMERGTIRLTRLVDNLLESVRVESGELAIRRQRVGIDAAIQEAVALVGPLLAHRGQRLETRLPAVVPHLAADPMRLAQALANLLANASKFGPPGSLIEVAVSVAADAVHIAVQDEGPGLAGANERSLFDRFYRASGKEPDAAGMGLGLWIVKSIVERHGGSVRALSREPKGSTFVISLPLLADSGAT